MSTTQRETTGTSHSDPANPRYSAAEKAWLKKNFKDEYHFLSSHNLSIYKEEDRAEGRLLLRGIMQGDHSDGDEPGDGSDNDFLRELEKDPTSHAADYHFTTEQLKWIKKHYGNATQFLLSYGLKFYDDDDCKEGKAIVKAMMDGDEE